MDKELEEAIEWIKNNIKYYQEQLKIISALDDSDYYDEETKLYESRIKIFKNILNYIENSISKEVIEGKIRELDKEEKEAQNSISDEEREEYSDSSIGYLLANIETRRQVLQELLEGK